MIEFVTVWFLVVTLNQSSNNAIAYEIPYATQNICLKQAEKVNQSNWKSDVAECKFGQLPVWKNVK